MLSGTVFRTAEQASAIGPAVGIALGMLGGCMWPLDIVPPGLRAVGHLTPQAWAMDGFIGLVFNGEGLADIARQIGVLALFAVALLTLGVVLLRRTLERGTDLARLLHPFPVPPQSLHHLLVRRVAERPGPIDNLSD